MSIAHLRGPALRIAALLALAAFPATATAQTAPRPIKDEALNGNWTVTRDGKKLADDAQLEVWSEIGARLRLDGKVYALTRDGDTLATAASARTFDDVLPDQLADAQTAVKLTIEANGPAADDDVIEGTIGGKTVKLERDTREKPPIVLALPGDRPFRLFLIEQLGPAANGDRESYRILHKKDVADFLRSCELYKHGSWQYKFMKGKTRAEQDACFDKMCAAIDGLSVTPRTLLSTKKFADAVTSNLRDKSQAGLALSTFSMYFSTGGGRSVRLPIAKDSTAYFITDRPSRSERIGLVVMNTPTHGPLASTFGRQLLDLGAMPATDDPIYTRTLLELLAKSDARHAGDLSPVGRSALTDWFAVMAIEDYRGVSFGNAELGWGYNMTNVQFYGLVVRALARPDQKDSKKKPILGQVVVGDQLQPGDPSYADVLNGGNDMSEYPDMQQLKKLTSDYMKEAHPDLIATVHDAFKGVVPAAELDERAQEDVFHFVCANLYDSKERVAAIKGKKADKVVDAVCKLFDQIRADSQQLETYLLAHGLKKSNDPAPRSKGF